MADTKQNWKNENDRKQTNLPGSVSKIPSVQNKVMLTNAWLILTEKLSEMCVSYIQNKGNKKIIDNKGKMLKWKINTLIPYRY